MFITVHDADSPKRKWPNGRPIQVRASAIASLRGYPEGRTRTVLLISGQFLHVIETERQVLALIELAEQEGR